MERVSVLLVGIGGYGENYIKEFLERGVDAARLAGVCDPFLEKSPYAPILKERGVPCTSSMEDFYDAEGSVDLVVISSPIHTHYPYIMTALDHGSNVLVEKPVVINTDLMAKLIARAHEVGRFVLVGYQMCYSRDLLALKEDILSGLYGKPVRMKSLRLMRRGLNYYHRNSWAGKLHCHGQSVFDSPLSNACAHQVENMLFLLGDGISTAADVTSVDGFLYKGNPEIENFDAASIRIMTDSGVELLYYTAHPVKSAKVGPISVYEFENAVIEEKEGSFTARFRDGSIKDYSAIDKGDRLQKLYDAIDACHGSALMPCPLEATVGHVRTVILAERLPVYLRPDAVRCEEGGDVYYAIPSLEEDFLSQYRDWKVEKLEYQIQKEINL